MAPFSEIVKHIAALFGLISIKYDGKVVEEGLRECTKATRRITIALKKATTISEKQQLLSYRRNIKSLRNQIKNMQKRGGGYDERKETAYHRVRWDDSISAFESRIRTGIITNLRHKDPSAFLEDCKAVLKRRIQNALKKDVSVKVNAVFCGEFVLVKGDKVQSEYKYFTTSNKAIYKDTNLNTWFDEKIKNPILIELEEFQERDSGWALKRIINLGININKFTPQLGSSYFELPDQIKRKHACVNVKNGDSACFAWSIISALYPVSKDPQRVNKYPHYSQVLNLTGIQFPMTIKQIPRFEKQNNVSINVYILQKKKNQFITLPAYLTKNKLERHVNLLLIQDKYFANDNQCDKDVPLVKYHYVWIKNLSRLLSNQLGKRHGQKFVCDRCLHFFHTKTGLDQHVENCVKMNECRVQMPELNDNILKFKNYKHKEKVPFIIYADIESVLKPDNKDKIYQEHVAAAVGYYFKCSYDSSLSFYRSYRGVDCVEWFVKELEQLSEDLETVFWCSYDMDPLTPEQEASFQNAAHCHICEQPFTSNDKKVRDHFHLMSGGNNKDDKSSNYRGPAHEGCNINYKDIHVIPVVFHNLSGYDAHFIINNIACDIPGRVDVLPITKEKYISFTKNIKECNIKFRFIDSFRFMNASLDTLSSYLKEFPNLKSQFLFETEEQFNLLTKKGIMPYDYIDCFEKFNDCSLPPIKEFYNKLEDKKCPRRTYLRAQLVWDEFKIKNLGEYVDLYMKSDILLLSDVFERFRESCLQTYGLDPAHYYTLPGYTWDCMLKHTEVKLELFTNIDHLLFIEKGIRGGLSQCSKRRASANNPYMANYDSSKLETYLMYFDVNNQYGWAMSQYLPTGDFKWVDTNIDVTTVPDDSPEGYILEVDLEYPVHLHDLHKDLPFCSEHINPKTGKADLRKNSKLMATLQPKKEYVIHYRNLKQALAHGLVLTKIHRVLQFKQSPWLKPYIDLNTDLRKNAKNDFEKNLFKLLNNAVFGKTIENIRQRVNVKLVTDWFGRYGAEALISKPEFKSCTVFNSNLVAIELQKLQIFFNKPVYVGMCILDLAKTTIYEFHYGYMKNAFDNSCTVLYTDTDSLIYEITNRDPYEMIKRDCYKYFDTSDYPTDNIYGIPQVNKKVLGMMKDENNGTLFTDFVGLRSKLYSVKLLTSTDELTKLKNQLLAEEYEEDEIYEKIQNYGLAKKAKGIKRSVVMTQITFEDYVECLDNSTNMMVEQNLIKADKFHIYSTTTAKTALSHFDDKRYLIPGSYQTLPLGHYSIKEKCDIAEGSNIMNIDDDSYL